MGDKQEAHAESVQVTIPREAGDDHDDFDPTASDPSGFVASVCSFLYHMGLRLFLLVPFSIVYFFVFMMLWPVRLIETRLHRTRGTSWEKMFLFPFNQKCARVFLFLLGIEVDCRGSWPSPEDGPMIITFNHASALDGLIIGAYLPLPHLVIAKAELRWYPIINLLFYVYGTIFVPRAKRAQAIQALRQASHRIAADRRCIIISPEGTRSRNGLLQGFKKGPFYLARESRIPILPIAIRGLFRLCPRNRLYPWPGRVALVCGAPISSKDSDIEERCGMKAPAGLEGEAFFRAHLAMDLWDQLKALLKENTNENLHLRPKYEGAENEEARPIHTVSVNQVESKVAEHAAETGPSAPSLGGTLESVGEDDVTPLPSKVDLIGAGNSNRKSHGNNNNRHQPGANAAGVASEPSDANPIPPLKRTAFANEQPKRPQRNRAMSFVF